MSSPITINVKASNDQKHIISIAPSETVLELKKKVAESCDTPTERMRLIFSGRVLKDHDTLEQYKISEGHTVHMVRSAVKPTTITPSTVNDSTTSASATPNPAMSTPLASASTNNYPTGAGPIPNPWTGFMNGGGMGVPGAGLGGNVDAMNAAMVAQMMQDPNFAQFMSSMLQNPLILESMFSTNPALRAMVPDAGHLMRSQQFQQMISNPDELRRIAQVNSMFGGSTEGDGGTRTASGAAQADAFNPFMPLSGASIANQGQTPQPQRPEERFEVQLKQLNDMGFWDAARNIRALLAAGGNVNGAIEILFSGSDRQN
ncbi:hypothetical protein B0O80DRAFT_437370 [Mortierella sp. GBAus27b]|nr:hypothetical protein BGX31_004283 [Mortierella sp. GBA43]KAI8361353.1 hypothetical protein B0O80DRAFT_437370 [Mortierella sp. GBAus27b]